MVCICYKQKELDFPNISGLATGSSWLCYYKALQFGDASMFRKNMASAT